MVATAPALTRVENCEPLPVPLRALDPTVKGPGPVTAEPGFHTSPNKTEKAQSVVASCELIAACALAVNWHRRQVLPLLPRVHNPALYC